MGIVIEHLDVEVGIGGHEVKNVALPHIGPVFPSNVPTLNEHLLQSILGCKVDVSLHFLVVGSVTSVWLYLVPVYLIEFDTGELVGIVP